MEKLITIFLLLFTFNTVNAQIKVEIKDGQISINDDGTIKNEFHLIHGTDPTKNLSFSTAAYLIMESDKVLDFAGIINYKKIDAEDKIIFWKNNTQEGDDAQSLFYCPKDDFFVKDQLKCTNSNTSNSIKYDYASQIAFPAFQEPNNKVLINNKTSRYLILDASPNHNKKINNSLFKPKDIQTFGDTDTFEDNFQKADALPVNGSLTIFIRNYNFHNLEKVSIEITGADFSYTYSIKDILAQLKTKVEENQENTKSTNDKESRKLSNDLTTILEKFKEYTYLNLNDLYKIEEYKKILYSFYELNFKSFTDEEIAIFSEIMNWYPQYLSITPIAITVPENDEVEINVTIKNKNEDTPHQTKVGHFKTTGGIGFNLGGMFYITNLKNNSVYTKASETSGQVRAFMNSENQSSVGIGLNSEIYFRTGYLLRPTLNMGFFIPFDEDLTPFGAIGPGISIASKKVKFSFSWGLAVGKVNTIKEQYNNVEFDPTDLTNDQLEEKVWKFGNYFGFGLTYNL